MLHVHNSCCDCQNGFFFLCVFSTFASPHLSFTKHTSTSTTIIQENTLITTTTIKMASPVPLSRRKMDELTGTDYLHHNLAV